MSIYCLVEGKTEKATYPSWFQYLLPKYTEVKQPEQASAKNYFVFSAGGQPLWNQLEGAIATVNEFSQYKYLLLCADLEWRLDRQTFIHEAEAELIKRGSTPKHAEIIYILQNRCIETWFLGNQNLMKQNKCRAACKEYLEFYDVSIHCPELMGKPDWYPGRPRNAIARFHQQYLQKIAKCNPKNNAKQFQSQEFVDGLKVRVTNYQDHLPSFQKLLDFCQALI
jgi:hypothetical protein